MTERMTIIGAGKMGKMIAGENAVSVRQTLSYSEILTSDDTLLFATEQKFTFNWLRQNSSFLSGKTLGFLTAFTPFEALEIAARNDQARLFRIMTDTSLQTISWSDDGLFSDEQKFRTHEQLSQINRVKEVRYLGARAEEALLKETIKACELGWLAQALDELTSIADAEVVAKVLAQHQQGLSFKEIAKAVATPKGATEAGQEASEDLFADMGTVLARHQVKFGLKRAREKSEDFINFAKQLV